jgi:hypothetical protein
MTPYSDEPRLDRWLIYTIGCVVFVGVLYYCMRRFIDASVTVSLAIAIPAGVVGFFAFAKLMEDTPTPPGFWGDQG